MSKILNWVISLFPTEDSRARAVNNFLAESEDLYDLDRRLRELDYSSKFKKLLEVKKYKFFNSFREMEIRFFLLIHGFMA